MGNNLKDKDALEKLKKFSDENDISDETLETLSDIEEELSNINAEQVDDNLADRQVEFLTNCMEQNLEHARHVENERMNFIQIHLVLVGGVLAFLSQSALETRNIAVLIILVAVTLLGGFVKALISRWDQVFIAHRACAMYCYTRIAELCNMKSHAETEFPTEITSEVRRKIPKSLSKPIPCYPFTFSQSGKTGVMIKWFINGLIIVTLLVTISYFFRCWIMPAL